MGEQDIRAALAAPFGEHELKFFPVAMSRDKKSARVGAYIDARAVMDRLDEVVGPSNWQTSYRTIDDTTKAVECKLALRLPDCPDCWVSKSDVGYPNEARDADNPDKEPFKAAYSDALKRAAVQFGIGRFIYSLQLVRDWLPVDEWGKFTEQPRVKGAPAGQVRAGTVQGPTPVSRSAPAQTTAPAPSQAPARKSPEQLAEELAAMKAAAAASPDCEHEPAYTATGTLVCSKCGEILPEPEGQPQQGIDQFGPFSKNGVLDGGAFVEAVKNAGLATEDLTRVAPPAEGTTKPGISEWLRRNPARTLEDLLKAAVEARRGFEMELTGGRVTS